MLANASIQAATTLQGSPLAPLSTASWLRLTSTLRRVPTAGVPAFAGMTRVGWLVWRQLAFSDTALTDEERPSD